MRHFPYTDHEFLSIDHTFLSSDHKFLSIDYQFQVMEPICDTCNEKLQIIVAERKSVEAHQKIQLAQEVAEQPHALGGQ